MELNDWILALHLLSAFAYVGAEVVFTSMLIALWRTDSTVRVTSFQPLTKVATPLVIGGGGGTIVFGIWLAISKEPYDLWDGWVIAAIVLWAIAGGIGDRTGKEYGKAADEAEKLARQGTTTSALVAETYGPSRAFWLHSASLVALALILIDMIWKPGA